MMKTLESTISSLIDSFINERDSRMDEKEKQVHLASKLQNSNEQEPTTGSSSTTNKEDSKSDLIDDKKIIDGPSADDIAEKLNSIRSGKSLRDSAVKGRFERYVHDLSDDEKKALFKFLKGISQIITGDIEPERAVEPQDPPDKITIHKKRVQTIKKNPNVIKKPGTTAKKNDSSAEDTSAPTPIKPVG